MHQGQNSLGLDQQQDQQDQTTTNQPRKTNERGEAGAAEERGECGSRGGGTPKYIAMGLGARASRGRYPS